MSSIENYTFSRTLRISNIHSVNPQDTMTDFTVNLNRMTETNNIVRCVCKYVEFPNNSYNIFDSGPFKNDEFIYEVNTVQYTATLPEAGFYTTNEILTILQPQIETTMKAIDAGTVLEIKLGLYSKKIEYTHNSLTAVLVLPSGPLNVFLGNNVNSGDITNAGKYVSDQTPNLYGLATVFIHSTTIAEGNLVDGDVENHDILAEVPVTAVYGQKNFYRANDDEIESINYSSVRNYDSIKIQLKDIDQNTIELNGGTVILDLKLYYL